MKVSQHKSSAVFVQQSKKKGFSERGLNKENESAQKMAFKSLFTHHRNFKTRARSDDANNTEEN